jgi:hypothetical protein
MVLRQRKQQGNWRNLYVRRFIICSLLPSYGEILKNGWMGHADNLVWIHNRKFDTR